MVNTALARLIDHTILKAETTAADVHRIVTEAVEYQFASVCVNPRWVSLVSDLLDTAGLADPDETACPVRTCGCVGFPLGANTSAIKAAEAAACVQDGAQEIDMVIALETLLSGDLAAARDDVAQVVQAARAIEKGTVVKVILETAVLNEEQIALGCRAVREAGANFVKTSTGLHPRGGATVQTVALLKKYAGGLKVKAAGGIRDLATAQAMIAAGADRLGCSASVALVTAPGA